MPLVFVHGVNNRDGPDYQADLAARDLLLRQYLLPYIPGGSPDMPIVNPYWGDLGASFAWGLRSVPGAPQGLEAAVSRAGAGDRRTPLADSAFAALARPVTTAARGQLEALPVGGGSGPGPRSLRQLAADDLPLLMEGLLGPLIFAEWQLEIPEIAGESPQEQAARRGRYEALLIQAADDAAHDPRLIDEIRRAPDDDAALDTIQEALRRHYRSRLAAEAQAIAPASDPDSPRVVASGLEGVRLPRGVGGLADQGAELIERMRKAPARAAGLGLLDGWRLAAHLRTARFLGDVFVYLQHRGSPSRPGPIVKRVLGAIHQAKAAAPAEPLILLTHSMGGNILYDLLNSFAPDLSLDAWISVGGQVAQFEEIKLFKASDPKLRHPERVPSLQPRVARWLNVYDPADVFSFLAEPVFAGARDLRYSSGSGLLGAHGDYFKRPSFYRLLRQALGGVA